MGAEATPGVRFLERGEFACTTHDQASSLADLLCELFPDPPCARLGLVELMFNAIEHGNLEIGGARKIELLLDGTFEAEIERRLAQPEFADRCVRVRVVRPNGGVEVTISDDGHGFAWRTAIARGLDDASAAPAGRGIALLFGFCHLPVEYNDPGNSVVLRGPA